MSEENKGEIPEFILVRDGHGVEHKVVNFDNPNICKRKGVIKLVAIKRNPKKEHNTNFRVARDPRSKVIYGIQNGVHPITKNLKFQQIKIGDFKIFDLSVPQDAEEWCVIDKAPFLLGGVNQKGIVLYKVHDEEAEAEIEIKKSTLRSRAEGIARECTHEMLIDLARPLGIVFGHNSPTVIRRLLIDKANKEPEVFINVYDGAHREIVFAVKRGLETGLITETLEHGWLFKDTLPLGMSEASVVTFLSKPANYTVLRNLEEESRERDNVLKLVTESEDKPSAEELKEVKTVEKAKEELNIEESPDPGNARMDNLENNMNKMMEMMQQLTKPTAAAPEQVVAETEVKVVTPPDPNLSPEETLEKAGDEVIVPTQEMGDTPTDLKNLKVLAKKLKVPGYHLFGNVDALKAKIEEYQAKVIT